VRLPLGKTTYWVLGPEGGPKVGLTKYALHFVILFLTKIVLIHGISTPSIIWKNIGPYLAEH